MRPSPATDTSSVAPAAGALPSIGAALGFSQDAVEGVVSAYALMFGGFPLLRPFLGPSRPAPCLRCGGDAVRPGVDVHRGKVLSRKKPLELVWNVSFDPGSNVVEVYVAALQRKIGTDLVETVCGIGYRFVVPGEEVNVSESPEEPGQASASSAS